MEPDIIRMYSSSPPPLDNGAEDDDDDEFGEFGGFSEVSPSGVGELLDVWTELQDIHDAHGLRYQWGGSHSNKKLLCSLGIDTRNILFTGNKKQPVIVPMYAAGLGMLEPTKEPLKPLSAAEKIASIGQTATTSSEMNTCASDQLQVKASCAVTAGIYTHTKPKREEHLSEEAAKVIASLPDLTFMHAKVLMFPATLTPSTSSQEKAD
ncbi:Aftiphilin [Tupaia chinensis]|uniref:Aftiphilin n=1 Tax=Tupaia chinensis TaxID=246437 RepID=L9KK27_TUPCH|nr:Aftiphilin [Tupaia chinensis]